MATEVGHAFVSIVPSLKGFSTKVRGELNRSGIDKRVSQQLTKGAPAAGKKAGDAFAGGFNTRARVGLSARSGVFAGLSSSLRGFLPIATAAAGAAGFFGLRTAASMEQAQIAFETMLGSAKDAKVFIASLAAFAKTTPFDFPGVVSASQKLLAFGFAAEDVLPTLTALGDAAAGLGLGTEGLDRLTTVVGQISAKGRVQSDEILQLTEAGVPALRILANQFDVSTKKIQKLVTEGLVPANKAIPALLSGLEKGTDGLAGATAKFGGLMDKQSRSLGGIISNLRDTISQGLAKAVRPLLPVLKDAIPAAMERLPGIFRATAKGIRGFLTGLGLLTDKAPEATSGLERVGQIIRSTFDFIDKHKQLFGDLALGLAAATAAAWLFAPAIAAIDALMAANPVGAIVLALEALVVGFIVAWRHSQTFQKIVGGVVQVIVGYFRILAAVWLNVVGSIVHAGVAAFGWLPGVGDKLKNAGEKFDHFKEGVDNTLSAIAHNAAGWGAKTGNNFVNGFGRAFAHGFNSIQANVNHALSTIAGSIDGFIKAARETGPILAGNFNPNVNTGGGNLPLKNPLEKIKPKKAEDLGFDFDTSLAKGVDDGSDKVKKSFADLVDKILGPLRELKQKAAQLAKSIADGITGETGFGSLGDRVDSLGASFGQSVRSIIDTFKAQRRDVAEFRRELRALERRGLSAGAVEDIAALGLAQGGSIADTLMGASRKQLAKLSKLRKGTNAGAAAIGGDVAQNRFGERISHEMARTRRAIEKASHNTDLTDRTVRRLSHAYARAARNSRPYVDITVIDRRDGVKVATS